MKPAALNSTSGASFHISRRQFLQTTSAATALAALPALGADALDIINGKPRRVGLIGAGWYGKSDLWRLIQVAPVEVVSICDVDKQMLAGAVEIDPTPQEVAWTVPLDEDEEHASYDVAEVATYFAAATRAALVLAALRAPYRGRSTPVNAWWGSFDLAVNLFSGEPAAPPSEDFIMRNAMDAQEVAVGWWPGDARYGKAAFYAYAHPAPAGFADATLSPAAARWDAALGEYVLDWDDVVASDDPLGAAVDFARSAFQHACAVCEWDPALAATAEGTPPPVA